MCNSYGLYSYRYHSFAKFYPPPSLKLFCTLVAQLDSLVPVWAPSFCGELTSGLLGTPRWTKLAWFWVWKTHLKIVANGIKGELEGKIISCWFSWRSLPWLVFLEWTRLFSLSEELESSLLLRMAAFLIREALVFTSSIASWSSADSSAW